MLKRRKSRKSTRQNDFSTVQIFILAVHVLFTACFILLILYNIVSSVISAVTKGTPAGDYTILLSSLVVFFIMIGVWLLSRSKEKRSH